MVNRIMDLLLIINAALLFGLIIYLIWWQKKHGKLSENRVATTLTLFFSFSVVTIFTPLFYVNILVALIVIPILLLLFWIIGYPWIKWVYRQFVNKK